MRLVILWLLWSFEIVCVARAQGQSKYVEVPNQNVLECVRKFVECRESFKNYGCMCRVQSQRTLKRAVIQDSWETIVFEDDKGRRRTDISWRRIDSGDDSETVFPTWTTFAENEKKIFFENGVEINASKVNGLDRFHFVPDPWMVTITEGDLIGLALGGEGNYWTKVLDEFDLLWGEENDQYIRGEWRFGAGEGRTYVQVYFQKDPPGLPVRVRYVLPHDWNVRFSENGKVVSENEIEWLALGDGFVPTAIRGRRQDLWAGMPGVKSSTLRSTDFFWETKLQNKDGSIDDDVFVPKKLTLEDVKASFSYQSPKSSDPNRAR